MLQQPFLQNPTCHNNAEQRLLISQLQKDQRVMRQNMT